MYLERRSDCKRTPSEKSKTWRIKNSVSLGYCPAGQTSKNTEPISSSSFSGVSPVEWRILFYKKACASPLIAVLLPIVRNCQQPRLLPAENEEVVVSSSRRILLGSEDRPATATHNHVGELPS